MPQKDHRRAVVWLDPLHRLTDTERACLDAAGLTMLSVATLEDFRMTLARADLVVIRLSDSIELLAEVHQLMRDVPRELPVVCRVDAGRLDLAVAAMRTGALTVLGTDEWSITAWRNALALIPTARETRSFVFVDPASQKLLALAQRVAQAEVTTLLTGPTGAGKEVLARVLHDASPRRAGPFVALNCAAMPESMIEDLLFGHEKGAFTGALREHAGVFEQANGGTLFLDEIAEMPYPLQSKLLRVLQEREVTRLGAQQAVPVDVRFIAATNRDLKAGIVAREFREDLYFRISTFRLRVPALAERPGDIVPLARHLLEQHAPRAGWTLTEEAERLLTDYAWPGNVRELANVMQRALVLASGPVIDAEHLLFEDMNVAFAPVIPAVTDRAMSAPAMAHESEDVIDLDAAVRHSEHRVILAALRAAPNRTEAAKALGISPRTLRYKLAQLKTRGLPVAVS